MRLSLTVVLVVAALSAVAVSAASSSHKYAKQQQQKQQQEQQEQDAAFLEGLSGAFGMGSSIRRALATAVPNPAIKYIVVLMEENRSFDEMLGWLKETNPAIEGLTGTESNPYNTSDPLSQRVVVNKFAKYSDSDPDHGTDATTEQVFGRGPQNVNIAPMDGFVENAESVLKGMGYEVMSCFTPDSAPVISTLATEFALFDHYFAAVPGPTQVNRMYLHSATSHGAAYNDDEQMVLGYPQKTIFKSLSESKVDWGVYFGDIPGTLLFSDMRSPEALSRYHDMEFFEEHIKAEKLPRYTFIEPRYFEIEGIPANDQHPSHSVADGEKLMKRIYEALRNSAIWNETLFIITYDEHGGFYDHFPTPLEGIPNPDGIISTNPAFNFTRLGVRVPFVAISPWIPKGMLVKNPVNATYFEHSSLPATLKKWFNLPNFLTKRDAWATDYTDITSYLSEPRTDCPTTLPSPPVLESFHGRPITGLNKLSHLQEEFIRLAAFMHGETVDTEGWNEAQGHAFVTERVAKFLNAAN
ncbi:phosphoesterase [Capsaspora owczarzaki ATCC 30864]|uniref:Phosphoesterase n=1 Tax=Capsaspora owczarzaki (strain ATCC 30864) TaxID=595528 RepID=A0A0D2WJZ0_CAPO3|nr:phosphoesterase [Capsaspora owczarzaki ATCC 30864]KJE90470.1 phosphoesterase [Capsaspora owczarzaki ATCC 30864]|eukprot:XP_004364648.1 phosphoesterase [Capsaspora owczarzaki ATCC 30864]